MSVVSRSRCLAVALVLTAAVWGAAAVVARWLLDTSAPRSTESALSEVCLVALLVALAWGWLQSMAAVLDAWRGAVVRTRSGVVRRCVLTACGVALAGAALSAPAHADTDPLDGLSLPDRPAGSAHPPRARAVVVHGGDTLWALAEAGLPRRAGPVAIAARSVRIHRLNRGVIGPDPDLILPGQVLRLPRPTTDLPTKESS